MLDTDMMFTSKQSWNIGWTAQRWAERLTERVNELVEEDFSPSQVLHLIHACLSGMALLLLSVNVWGLVLCGGWWLGAMWGAKKSLSGKGSRSHKGK